MPVRIGFVGGTTDALLPVGDGLVRDVAQPFPEDLHQVGPDVLETSCIGEVTKGSLVLEFPRH